MRRVWMITILLLFSLSLVQQPSMYATQRLDVSKNVGKNSNPSQLISIERDWTAHIIVVNYDESLIDESELLAGMPTERTEATDTVLITYNIQYDVYYADQNYIDDLSQVVMDNSINGSETGTRLNETALLYQKTHLSDPQRIFYPRAGRVIDGYAVEDWLEANPYVTPPSLGYTIYMVNFSSLDTSGHGLEHWYDYYPVDPDTGEEQDWFRLEWDNELNPNVTMDHPNFGGRYNTYFVDPSAHQWYLKWCRIWWSEMIGTEYEFWTQDLEDKVATLDLAIPADIDTLNVYLRECIWDPINLLLFPYQHQPAKYVQAGILRSLVICMDVAEGTSIDSLRWVTNAEMQKRQLERLYPFIDWNVRIDFIDIEDYPMWNTTFWNDAYVDENGTTIADGGAMFDAIYDTMRPQYIDVNSDDIEVFGVVFIKKQMEMHVYGRTYTGLGGGGQTVIWKSWERYYRPDGVTPKDGISAVQLHETMHAIGFHHSWQHEHYSSDFSYGPMGYFTFHNDTATFDKNWVQGTYLDQMHAILWDTFTTIQADLGVDERPETYVAEQKIIDLFGQANSLYNEMDWMASYLKLSQVQDWIDRLTWSTQDDSPPTIVNWVSNPQIGLPGFEVQAQVTDDLSGIENVTAYVALDGNDPTTYLCSFSSGSWFATIPSLTATSVIEVWIVAWDWGMNRAESNHEILALDSNHSTTGTGLPPDALLLYITLIAGIGLVAIVVIVIMKKKQ